MNTHATMPSVKCLCILIFVLSPGPPGRAADFAGGSGTPDDPYQIATAEHLIAIGTDPNLLDKHFALIADIDLDPNLPTGRIFDDAVIPDWFSGDFDGRGRTIHHLTIVDPNGRNLALFSRIDRDGRVANVNLTDAVVSGRGNVGVLAAVNYGAIRNCHASAFVSGGDTTGGLVADNWLGAITRCSAAGVVTGGSDAAALGGLAGYNTGTISSSCAATHVSGGSDALGLGGLVGVTGYFGCIIDPEKSAILNCCATGNVSAGNDGSEFGGLVGAHMEGTITNCYATGAVASGDSSARLGGLVGENGAPGGFGGGPGIHMGTIANSYATGRVEAGPESRLLGGLVGSTFDGSTVHSFWDIETTGQLSSDGGAGLPTAQMQSVSAFRFAGWDFVGESANGTADPWQIPERGGYPVLTAFVEDYQPRELAGVGTPEDPFQIATPEDLGAIGHHDVTASYRLIADVNLAGITFSAAPIPDFHGTFDGGGFAVSNLAIRGGGHLGLFGTLGSHASVTDLAVRDATVQAAEHAWCVGILAAQTYAPLMRCGVTGTIAAGDSAKAIGGLVGDRQAGDIAESYAVAHVSAGKEAEAVGGLIGSNLYDAVANCYARGSVTCDTDSWAVGGLIGEDSSNPIAFSYSSATVRGGNSNNPIGGRLVGHTYESSTTNCYYLTAAGTSGPDNGRSSPLTDSSMKQQSSFVDWDFADIWTICEGLDYPRLQWEGVPCDQ